MHFHQDFNQMFNSKICIHVIVTAFCINYKILFSSRHYLSFYFIFYQQLQDVLAKSDRAMAVVRDLFGDDPKVRFRIISYLQLFF